ncbi:V-type H+-transporting ATPase subunit F [Acrasis kona]|uniref:V-type proton ATPase subunit F n=1 Tax=Acrasis kona TaxID=1008807 RepID=A0AAW2YMV2_9EUKA
MTDKMKLGSDALVAVMGDEDTVTGFLLAGIGDMNKTRQPNFLIVDNKVDSSQIEETFKKFVARKDIAIILINQHVADQIRGLLNNYDQIVPAILEIPSKEIPYDPSKDYILSRVKQFLG